MKQPERTMKNQKKIKKKPRPETATKEPPENAARMTGKINKS
jgi:hypothetical protein